MNAPNLPDPDEITGKLTLAEALEAAEARLAILQEEILQAISLAGLAAEADDHDASSQFLDSVQNLRQEQRRIESLINDLDYQQSVLAVDSLKIPRPPAIP